MTILVPKELKAFWDNLPANLPELKLQYSEDAALPQATYRATGFAREHMNAGFFEDVHRYEITVLTDNAPDAYSMGMEAAALLDEFAPPGLVLCTVEPDEWATPMKAGQLDIWHFRISLTLRIIPG